MPIFSQILTSRHRFVPRSWLIENLDVRRCKYYYCSPTQLWEGNVFSRVCLSVILSTRWTYVTISYDELDLTTKGPLCTGTTPTPWCWHLVVTVACTGGQELVCLPLECFLVTSSFWVCLVIEWDDLRKRYDCLMLIRWLINYFIY